MSSDLLFPCIFLGNHTKPGTDALVPNGYPLDGSDGFTRTSWEQLLAFITKDRLAKSKAGVKLFLPGKLFDDAVPNEKGSTLNNHNVELLSFVALDIEGGGVPGKPKPLLTLEDICAIDDRLAALPFETCFFNSYSNNLPGKGFRGRILIPLAHPICPTRDFNCTRENQGKWWSSSILMAIAEHVLGDWVRHPGIFAGLDGCKLWAGKYYLRSQPTEGDASKWCERHNAGRFWDPREFLAATHAQSQINEVLGLKDAIGIGISPSKLKTAIKRWQTSSKATENLAAITLERVQAGQRAAEDGGGFEAVSELCRLLLLQCRPFDYKVVSSTLFRKSCEAYAIESKTSVESEIDFVNKRFEHWAEELARDDAARAKEIAVWRGGLDIKPSGELKPSSSNLAQILRKHPAWQGVLGFNERTGEACFLKDPPQKECCKPFYPHPIEERDALWATVWFAQTVQLTVEPKPVGATFDAVAVECRSFDPVREYFESLEWDGQPRLDEWLIRFAGAQDNKYIRAVSAKWLISAVARTFEPGCKADHVLVLEGPQGIRKSTLFKTLCPHTSWFTDTLPDLHNKDSFLQLRGKLIIEISELNAMARATNADIKKYFSSDTDTYRPPYAQRTVDVKRRVIFAGSTNDSKYTSDPTGARRFWPVRVTRPLIDIDGLADNRDQIWAEAVHRYGKNESWWLDPFTERLAQEQQTERRVEDPFEEILDSAIESSVVVPMPEKLDGFASFGGPLKRYDCKGEAVIMKEDVYILLGFKDNRTPAISRRVVSSMTVLGWEDGPYIRMADGVRVRTYKKTVPLAPVVVSISGTKKE